MLINKTKKKKINKFINQIIKKFDQIVIIIENNKVNSLGNNKIIDKLIQSQNFQKFSKIKLLK